MFSVILPSKDMQISNSNIDNSRDAAAWSTVTNYTSGAQVTFNGYTYNAITSNQAQQPDTSSAWAKIGVSNANAYLDDVVITRTVATAVDNSIRFTITGGGDYVGFLGIAADTLTINGVSVQIIKEVDDWWEYYSAEIEYEENIMQQFAVTEVGFRETLNIIIARSGMPAELGKIFVGRKYELGALEWGASSSMTDYSSVQKDEFGFASIVQRGYVKNINGRIPVETSKAITMHDRLMRLRATPVLWIEESVGIMTYGLVQKADLTFTNTLISYITIDNEGLL